MTPRQTTIHQGSRDPRQAVTGPLLPGAAPPDAHGPHDAASSSASAAEHTYGYAADTAGVGTDDAYGCVEWFDFDAPCGRSPQHTPPS